MACVAARNQWEATWQKQHQNIRLIVLSEGSGKPSTPAVGSAALYLFQTHPSPPRRLLITSSSPRRDVREITRAFSHPNGLRTRSALGSDWMCLRQHVQARQSQCSNLAGRENLRQTPSPNVRTSKRPGQKFAHLRGLLMFHQWVCPTADSRFIDSEHTFGRQTTACEDG